jgi:hypothetical protein
LNPLFGDSAHIPVPVAEGVIVKSAAGAFIFEFFSALTLLSADPHAHRSQTSRLFSLYSTILVQLRPMFLVCVRRL